MEPNDQVLLLIILFFWLFVFPFCTCIDSITSNRSILDDVVLLSKNNIFALGFFSPGNSSNRYVGIWYHKIPEMTVVWVANRDKPINGSNGVLSINDYGNLVLIDVRNPNVPLWSTNVPVLATNINARTANLLDSGDLVLEDDDTKRVVWRSFDHPSDTLLPGMKVGLDIKSGFNRFLTSWKSPEDPGTGEYSFKVDSRGSPQFFLYKGTTRTMRSPPWPWPWSGNTETAAAYVYNYSFVNSEDEIYHLYSPNDASVITRRVLKYTGLLVELTWHDVDRQWKCSHAAPRIPCDQYGHCGANSKCNSNSMNVFECMCLPGFEPSSPKDWYLRDGSRGCARKRAQAYGCRGGEGFLKVARVKLPDTSAAKTEKGWSVEACKKACLSNCSCTAYAMSIDGNISVCLTWHGELNDTVEYVDVGPDLYVRVDAIELAENANKSRGFLGNKGMLATLILSAGVAFFLLVILAYFWQMKRRNARDSLVANDELEESRDSPDLPCLDLSIVVAATDNFSSLNKLGQGGFGTVYKGQLFDGQEIAVKRLSKSSGQGMEELKNEVKLIAKLQHRNLVKLLGSCIEGEERLLIYEYLPNKSLDSFIFDETRRLLLDWRKRFAIIVGVARGILYLHQDSRLRIIHRDLKSSNVLLDADMNPKISDFGMARIFRGDQIQDNTNRVVGTYGYMSPEYALFGKFSTKSDVFSFGVILLEIVSGKKNTCYSQDEPSMTLIGHVWELWREERALEILDSSLVKSYHPPEALRCIHIGLLCVEESVMDRPTMLEVVLMLVGEATLPPPKQPAFVFKSICNGPHTSAAGEWSCSINEVTITDIKVR